KPRSTNSFRWMKKRPTRGPPRPSPPTPPMPTLRKASLPSWRNARRIGPPLRLWHCWLRGNRRRIGSRLDLDGVHHPEWIDAPAGCPGVVETQLEHAIATHLVARHGEAVDRSHLRRQLRDFNARRGLIVHKHLDAVAIVGVPEPQRYLVILARIKLRLENTI